MGTLADSLFNLLMGWVRALVNAIWALFTTDHTTLLEFLGKNWVLIVVVILAAGLAIDWLVWLIRWQPYHLWARRARRFLRMPEPEQEEKRKKRAPSGDETQKMPAAYAQTDSGAPEEEEEEQWLPLQQPQMDERQAQEVMQRAQSVPDEELGAYPGMRYGAKAAEGMAETQRYSAVRAEGPGAAEVERQIRGCRWMREHRGLRAQIIWIDRGLTPEGQEAAARLLRDAAGEQLCAAGQAAEYLERLGAFEA